MKTKAHGPNRPPEQQWVTTLTKTLKKFKNRKI